MPRLLAALTPESHRHRLVLLFVAAIAWWAAGAFGIFPLGWLALVPFFCALSNLDARRRAGYGYLGGFVACWLINWWLLPTVARGAPVIGAPVWAGVFLGLLSVTIIAAGHAAVPTLAAILWRPGAWWAPWLTAAGWTALDWVRCNGPLANSWGVLAFSQAGDLPLINALPSQYALTAFCVVIAGSTAYALGSRSPKLLALPFLLLIAAHGGGWWRLRSRPASTRQLRVMLVQTNVSSLRKTGNATGETPFVQAYRLTSEALAEQSSPAAGNTQGPADLVIWPETTAKVVREQSGLAGLDYLTWTTLGPRVPLLMGADVQNADRSRRNELLLFTPQQLRAAANQAGRVGALGGSPQSPTRPGTGLERSLARVPWAHQANDMEEARGRDRQNSFGAGEGSGFPGEAGGADVPVQAYAKRHLVPFGERAPFENVLPFLKFLAPQPPVEPGGAEAVSLNLGPRKPLLLPLICFESCFPLEGRLVRARAGAEQGAIVVVATNDEWYLGTEAPLQHRQMAVIRAVEGKMPVVQAANGGLTFAIDAQGRVLGQLLAGEAAVLSVAVPY